MAQDYTGSSKYADNQPYSVGIEYGENSDRALRKSGMSSDYTSSKESSKAVDSLVERGRRMAEKSANAAGAGKKMMPGGNTMISVNSMKGEALRGRSDNLSSKKGFKSNRYARSAE